MFHSEGIHIEASFHPDIICVIHCCIGCAVQEDIWLMSWVEGIILVFK